MRILEHGGAQPVANRWPRRRAEVSGEWVLDRQPTGDAGVLVFVRVDEVEATLQKIVEAGGEIIVPRTPQGEGIAYATFRDPAGNVLGIFQEAS